MPPCQELSSPASRQLSSSLIGNIRGDLMPLIFPPLPWTNQIRTWMSNSPMEDMIEVLHGTSLQMVSQHTDELRAVVQIVVQSSIFLWTLRSSSSLWVIVTVEALQASEQTPLWQFNMDSGWITTWNASFKHYIILHRKSNCIRLGDCDMLMLLLHCYYGNKARGYRNPIISTFINICSRTRFTCS